MSKEDTHTVVSGVSATEQVKNWEYDFKNGGVKCLHTKEPCVVNDTATGSSCSICLNNPKSELTLNNQT